MSDDVILARPDGVPAGPDARRLAVSIPEEAHVPEQQITPDPHGHVGPDVEVPHLEADETVPPRPEEEIADVARQAPRRGSDAVEPER